ncbi:MAG: glutaredoxin family protein [Neisseriaceae bacterium]|nr:glutaredoxin family protein [Neisseriaceae bacterium]
MIDQLECAQKSLPFELNLIDIDDSDELEERFALLIPILMAGETPLFHYHYSDQKLRKFLAKHDAN